MDEKQMNQGMEPEMEEDLKMEDDLDLEEEEQGNFYVEKAVLWICFFPIMLLVTTARTEKIPATLKALLFVLQLGLWGTAGFFGYRHLTADKEAPVLTAISTEAGYGADISVETVASIKDNKDQNPDLVFESSSSADADIRSGGRIIVFRRPGEYTVTVTGTDSSGNKTSLEIPISIIDNVVPEIVLREAKTFSVKEEISVSDLASAKDEIDPAPSLKIIAVTDGGKISNNGEVVSFDMSGTFSIGLLSTDASGNTVKNTLSVIVKNDILPELILSEEEIQIDEYVEEVAFEDYAEAKSEVYGDLNESIIIDYSQVVFGKPGTYMVTYSAEDPDHHEVTAQLRVVIMDTTAPEINLDNTYIEYTVGEDIPDYMDGIWAEDENDGNLTDKVIVDSSDVDYQNAGSYEVIYTVVDQAGNRAVETAIVEVQEDEDIIEMQEDDIGEVQEEFMDRTSVIDEMDEFESYNKQTSETEDEEQVMSYVLNTNTMRFHYPYCSSASTIKDNNREDFEGTRKELLERNYKPCGKCNP